MKFSSILCAVTAGLVVEGSAIPQPQKQNEIVEFKKVEWKNEVPDNKFVVEEDVKQAFIKNVKKDKALDKKRRDELRLKNKDQKVVCKVVQEVHVVNVVLKGKPAQETLYIESEITANFDKKGDKTIQGMLNCVLNDDDRL